MSNPGISPIPLMDQSLQNQQQPEQRPPPEEHDTNEITEEVTKPQLVHVDPDGSQSIKTLSNADQQNTDE